MDPLPEVGAVSVPVWTVGWEDWFLAWAGGTEDHAALEASLATVPGFRLPFVLAALRRALDPDGADGAARLAAFERAAARRLIRALDARPPGADPPS